eukprot:TRINITY_DN20769_c0_g2_i1.p1 TRINITY_DN20769_c0_g2~~TRINITY_DN20769_c0_g2_i1.p1  ORF type:complete len:311 (+),score=48.62 TRINITY_DN20769_c0_g2_i1:102-1034(+)
MPKEALLQDAISERGRMAMIKEFGTKEDQKAWKEAGNEGFYEQFQDFLDKTDSINFWTYMALKIMDPDDALIDSDDGWREIAKVFLLPLLQLVVPLMIIYENLYNSDEGIDWSTNGICPAENKPFHRFIAAVFMLYSLWSLIDSFDYGGAVYLMQKAAFVYRHTGVGPSLWFCVGFFAQAFCGVVLILSLYLQMAVCTTVLDMCFACFGINFLLDVDDEWVSQKMYYKHCKSRKRLFRRWRDACNAGSAGHPRSWLRRNISWITRKSVKITKYTVACCGYFMCVFTVVCNYTPIAAWTTASSSDNDYDYS